jgi:uncharacterized spore protein YtfJ
MDLVKEIQDRFNAGIVYGEATETESSIVIPAARVMGGGGGGSDANQGEGAGFGLSATPAGAWVIENGDAQWRPAIDVNRIILGGQIVAVTFLLFSWLKSRARAKAKRQAAA